MKYLKKRSKTGFTFSVLFCLILAIGSCNSSPVKEEKSDVDNNKKEELTFEYYEGQFSEIKSSKDKFAFLELLNKSDNPETAVLIIPLLFDPDEEVKDKAYITFEGYRRFAITDLSRHFYDSLDVWFKNHPETIVKQMGFYKEYRDFLEKRSEKGLRNHFYKKNPLRFLLKTKKIFRLIEKVHSIEEKPLLQFWTIWLIGAMKMDSELPFLLKLLKKKTNGEKFHDLRVSVVWALTNFYNKKWNVLFVDLIKENNPYLQELIVYSIGKLRDRRFKPLFLDLLNIDREWQTQQLELSIIWALTRMKSKELIPFILSRKKGKQSQWIEIQKLWAIYYLNIKKTSPILLKSLYSESKYVREVSLLILEKTADPSMTDQLLPLLDDKSVKIRILVLKLFSKWKAKKAVPKIITLLDDPNEKVRIKAIKTLGKIQSTKGTNALLALLKNEKKPLMIKAFIVESLLYINNKSTLKPLIRFYEKQVLNRGTNETGNEVKEESITSVKQLPPLSQVLIQLANEGEVLELLNSSNEYIQISALKAITHLKKADKDYSFLFPMLKTKSDKVYIEIIKLFGEVQYKKALPLLRKLIRSGKIEASIKKEAIRSLGKLQQIRDSQNLFELVHSLDDNIKYPAIEALGYFSSKRGIPILKEVYAHSKSNEEKVLIICSLALLNYTELKYNDDLIEIARDNGKEVKQFVRRYFNRLSSDRKKRLIKTILNKTARSHKEIINRFFSID